MQNRVGRHHLGVKPGAARQQAVEGAAVPVRPLHHRRHAEAVPTDGFRFFSVVNHLAICPDLLSTRPTLFLESTSDRDPD
jgi:hypothetical protein